MQFTGQNNGGIMASSAFLLARKCNWLARICIMSMTQTSKVLTWVALLFIFYSIVQENKKTLPPPPPPPHPSGWIDMNMGSTMAYLCEYEFDYGGRQCLLSSEWPKQWNIFQFLTFLKCENVSNLSYDLNRTKWTGDFNLVATNSIGNF